MTCSYGKQYKHVCGQLYIEPEYRLYPGDIVRQWTNSESAFADTGIN